MSASSWIAEGLFWFCELGATAAALKHLYSPEATFRELTPAAFVDEKRLHPASLWWGSFAFSAMNFGYAVIGLYCGVMQSKVGKQAFLLGTGSMFLAFALAWVRVGGTLTGHKRHLHQAAKISAFGVTFLTGFVLSIL